ncbi:MAG: DUF5104 domain-containing protein [Oscillospiraceae bacterium]|nr:DUF5104 domain-containing protein [Oscillospiraceae bacterium]
MNKILAGILAFLLWLMPWWTGLYNAREKLSFDATAVCNRVINCVKAHDAATLASMMRPWLRNNVSDLTDRIEQLLDTIDGNVTEIGINRSEYTSNDAGIYRVGKHIFIYVGNTLYNLRVYYDVTNSNDKNEVGISWLEMVVAKGDGTGFISLDEIKMP